METYFCTVTNCETMKRLVPAVALAFVLGVLVGGVGGVGGVGVFDSGILDNDSSDESASDAIPLVWGTGGPGCFDAPTPNAGWVHEVAAGESYAVTLNATVVHERGERVEPNATEWADGRYRLDLRTVPDDGRAKTPENCRAASSLRIGMSLPTDYERLEIAVNGRTLRTIERENTVADLYQLPNPIDATADA